MYSKKRKIGKKRRITTRLQQHKGTVSDPVLSVADCDGQLRAYTDNYGGAAIKKTPGVIQNALSTRRS